MENTKQYIEYDYKEVTVSKKFELAWKDGYTNFGWEIEKIQNKNELNRLQVSLEATLNEMEHLEETKILEASIAAYIIGLIGTVFMAL